MSSLSPLSEPSIGNLPISQQASRQHSASPLAAAKETTDDDKSAAAGQTGNMNADIHQLPGPAPHASQTGEKEARTVRLQGTDML